MVCDPSIVHAIEGAVGFILIMGALFLFVYVGPKI